MKNFSVPNYEIIKVMNNNVIIAKNLQDLNEQVLVGRGLGFGMKSGKTVSLEDDKIEKKFVALNQTLKQAYFQLVEQLDLEVMGLCEEFIAYADDRLLGLNPHIHIALTDHIGFAIERIRSGQEIYNPFLHQIKALYREEYSVASKAKEMIQSNLGIEINASEIAFIALHLHSSRKNRSVKETVQYARVISSAVEIIERSLNIKLDESSLTYARLISHLRSLMERVASQQNIENKLLESIRKEFKKSFSIAKNIARMIENDLGIKVDEEEQGYMAIHIDRVRRTMKK